MTRVQDEFRTVGVTRGGLLMLRPADAIQMVRRCRELDIEVLGIDGFFLTATTTQPTMENSIDLSGSRKPTSNAEGWETAEAFIAQRSTSDLFFEIVILSKVTPREICAVSI